MSILRTIKKLRACYLAKPPQRRKLHRAIVRNQVARIVELGVGDASRAAAMLHLAACSVPRESIQYCGIDLFEANEPNANHAEPSIALKEAYRRLKSTGVSIQLVPGDPLSALGRMGNELAGTDLLVISRAVDRDSLKQAWFFVPRILHDRSVVLIERASGDVTEYHALAVDEIQRSAAAARRRAA